MSKSTKQCKNIWNVYDGVPAKWGIVYLFLVFCWSNEILLIFLSRFIFHVLTYTCFCRYDHVIYTGTMQDDCYLWRHGQLSLHYCHLHRDYAGWLLLVKTWAVVTSLLSFTQGLYRMTVKTWPVVTSLLSFTQGLCRMTVKTWAVVTSL
jgi:hypothetical protein